MPLEVLCAKPSQHSEGMGESVHLPEEVLHAFVVDVFAALGVPTDDAHTVADVLIASDLRGIDSHGVARLKYYYHRLVDGVQRPVTMTTVVKDTETTAVLEGGHGMGHVVACQAMQMAMNKAKDHGLGSVSVRNSSHFGSAGYYARMAANRGMMGLAVTNATPTMAPTFGREPMLGTNPIAFAAPSDMGYPFCFDAATSVASYGKMELREQAGKSVPVGWAADKEGRPLTKPVEIYNLIAESAAVLLPLGGAGESLGGHKGYGLATMVEILSASLSGGSFQRGLGGYARDGSHRLYMLGHFVLAIDIKHFIPLEQSRRITGQIMRNLQGSRKAVGHGRIYVAGEKEHEMEQRRRREGIPLGPRVYRELRFLRDELAIEGYERYF
jgi:L-2-hydroxycarboxylate dehydrogenase (NAD+)